MRHLLAAALAVLAAAPAIEAQTTDTLTFDQFSTAVEADLRTAVEIKQEICERVRVPIENPSYYTTTASGTVLRWEPVPTAYPEDAPRDWQSVDRWFDDRMRDGGSPFPKVYHFRVPVRLYSSTLRNDEYSWDGTFTSLEHHYPSAPGGGTWPRSTYPPYVDQYENGLIFPRDQTIRELTYTVPAQFSFETEDIEFRVDKTFGSAVVRVDIPLSPEDSAFIAALDQPLELIVRAIVETGPENAAADVYGCNTVTGHVRMLGWTLDAGGRTLGAANVSRGIYERDYESSIPLEELP